MKKIILNKATAPALLGIINKMVASNGSIIFPSKGTKSRTSKFGKLRKVTSIDPMKLTTHRVKTEVLDDGIRISNPLNEGFGYSEVIIDFGTMLLGYDSFFWKDSWGYWRQMKFSKQPGWALTLSGGRMDIYIPPTFMKDIPSRFPSRVNQFLTGTGDW